MNDLAHRPAAFAVRRVELRILQAFHGGADFSWGGSNLFDRLLAPGGRHWRGHLKISDRVAWIHADVLLWQRDISLDYIDACSCRSMPPAERTLSNLAAHIPNRGGGDVTISAPLYPAGMALNLIGGERLNVQRPHHRQRLRRSHCRHLPRAAEPQAPHPGRARAPPPPLPPPPRH